MGLKETLSIQEGVMTQGSFLCPTALQAEEVFGIILIKSWPISGFPLVRALLDRVSVF